MNAPRVSLGRERDAAFDTPRLLPPNSSSKADDEGRESIRRSFVILAIYSGLEALERGDVSEYHEWQAQADKAASWGRQ
jgi:hypothetical protein